VQAKKLILAAPLSHRPSNVGETVLGGSVCPWWNLYWVFPKNGGFSPPNHPILIGISNINHPFLGYCTPIFGNTHWSWWESSPSQNVVLFFGGVIFLGGAIPILRSLAMSYI